MKLQLQSSEREGGKGHFPVKRFSFAVVDLDKADAYPLNFVCMLPISVDAVGKVESEFVRVFGDKSCEVAEQLYREALERETDAHVKTEIEHRLSLLEPKPEVERRCAICGKIFLVQPRRRFRQKYCSDCLKKKFGNRK